LDTSLASQPQPTTSSNIPMVIHQHRSLMSSSVEYIYLFIYGRLPRSVVKGPHSGFVLYECSSIYSCPRDPENMLPKSHPGILTCFPPLSHINTLSHSHTTPPASSRCRQGRPGPAAGGVRRSGGVHRGPGPAPASQAHAPAVKHGRQLWQQRQQQRQQGWKQQQQRQQEARSGGISSSRSRRRRRGRIRRAFLGG
jgi:hypothetical protein